MDFASLHPISGGHADLILYLFWQTAQSSGKRASCAENRLNHLLAGVQLAHVTVFLYTVKSQWESLPVSQAEQEL